MAAGVRVRVARSVALLASVVLLNGCGLILVQPPPSAHADMDYFSCTESNAGPVLDIVWAGLNFVGALAAAAEPNAYANAQQIQVVGFSWTLVSSVSAGVGFSKTRRCREARATLASRLAGRGPDAGIAGAIVTAVVVAPGTDTMLVGEQRQLRVAAFNASGGPVGNRTYRWSSSNDAIASVDNAGLVTARAVGTVVIAANTGNVVGVAAITVREQ